jgi:fumarate hydratase class II
MGDDHRIERDGMGEVRVPSEALWGAQTQRAVENFAGLSGLRLPRAMIRALGLVKGACAAVNGELGLLDPARASAIEAAAAEVASGRHDEHFPVDVFQTGSGTSSNMNANEVIARLAAAHAGVEVHPNDHVNLGQSSNDVFPAATRVSACLRIDEALLPALDHLAATIERRAAELDGLVTTGRTHLMDAMPIRLGQELGGWAAQVRLGLDRVRGSLGRLAALPLGGTAVGTGVNAAPGFGPRVVARLARDTGFGFTPAENLFEGLSSLDAAVEMSGQLRVVAVSLMKIANDLRWMNSGPRAGLGEIRLPALQPGSSIMPGKVNPVIPEAVAMACAQVMGLDVAIGIAGQSGNFQLNAMQPLAAYDLHQGIELLTGAARALADKAIAGFAVDRERISAALERNPILATALAPVIGYDAAALVAKRADQEGRSIREVAREMTGLSDEELARRLDPVALTGR